MAMAPLALIPSLTSNSGARMSDRESERPEGPDKSRALGPPLVPLFPFFPSPLLLFEEWRGGAMNPSHQRLSHTKHM